jgi:nucleotide-binding universal stress UspA family protein
MKILLTLDGTAFAERAIPEAQRLAAEPTAEVHLLVVIDSRAQDKLPLGAELVLAHYLEDVARLFPANVVCPVIRVGPYPADQIAAYAEAHQIDRIVMATHGYSAVQHAAHGSVAEQVVHAGVAPVTLVQPALVA